MITLQKLYTNEIFFKEEGTRAHANILHEPSHILSLEVSFLPKSTKDANNFSASANLDI